MPPEGYIYYTSASDARKVLGKPRTSKNAPAEFHTFDSEVVSIDHETYTRRSCYLIFALADGTAMVYTTLGEHLSPTTNLATFEEQRVVATFQVDGKSAGPVVNTETLRITNSESKVRKSRSPSGSGNKKW